MAAIGSALGGAGTGAAIGSVIPGIGTAIGGLVGGVGGLLGSLFGGNDRYSNYEQAIERGKTLAPPSEFHTTPLDEESYRKLIAALQQQATTGGAQAGESREQQMQFVKALQDQAAGRGQSLAQLQLTQAADEATKRSAGQIGSTTGINPALQARLIAENNAVTQLGLAGQSGRLRMEEQFGTQGLLNQALTLARSGDLATQQAALQGGGTSGQLAGSEQQRVLAQQGLEQQVAAGNQQAQLDAAHLNAQMQESNAGRATAQSNIRTGGLVSGLGSAAAMIPGMFPGGGGTSATPDMTPISIAHGGMIPGKDSESYDTVHAMLSPGEIVVPRSITQKGDAPDRAAKFVAEIQKRAKGGKVTKEPNYGPVLAKLKRIKLELAALGV